MLDHNLTRVGRTASGTTSSNVGTPETGTNRLAELRDGSGVFSRAITARAGGDVTQTTRAVAPTLGYASLRQAQGNRGASSASPPARRG